MAQIIVRLKERELKTVPVTCVATRIGRDASNDVVIENDGVSRHHATLRYEASVGAFLIYDASSSNGMFFRGSPSKAARLDDGDEVQIGKFTLVFQEAGGAPLESLSPEPPRDDVTPTPAVHNPLPTMALPAAKLKPKPRTGAAIAPSASPLLAPPRAPSRSTAPPEPAPQEVAPATVLAPPTSGEIIAQSRTLRYMMWLMVALVVLLVALLAMLVLQR
jgi:pSer/pThr/pTyr-binding forkhead associated (FHA) protein